MEGGTRRRRLADSSLGHIRVRGFDFQMEKLTETGIWLTIESGSSNSKHASRKRL